MKYDHISKGGHPHLGWICEIFKCERDFSPLSQCHIFAIKYGDLQILETVLLLNPFDLQINRQECCFALSMHQAKAFCIYAKDVGLPDLLADQRIKTAQLAGDNIELSKTSQKF